MRKVVAGNLFGPREAVFLFKKYFKSEERII